MTMIWVLYMIVGVLGFLIDRRFDELEDKVMRLRHVLDSHGIYE